MRRWPSRLRPNRASRGDFGAYSSINRQSGFRRTSGKIRAHLPITLRIEFSSFLLEQSYSQRGSQARNLLCKPTRPLKRELLRNCSDLWGSTGHQASYRGAAKHGICFASRLVPSNVNSYTVTPPFTPLTFLLHWESQPDTTLPYDSGRRSVRSGLPAPKLGRRRRTVLKLSYRGIP